MSLHSSMTPAAIENRIARDQSPTGYTIELRRWVELKRDIARTLIRNGKSFDLPAMVARGEMLVREYSRQLALIEEYELIDAVVA